MNKLTSLFNQDFGRIVKFYNRIATALVKFENLWLSLWRSRVDSACSGLKVSLLAYHPETKQLLVNADGRYNWSSATLKFYHSVFLLSK